VIKDFPLGEAGKPLREFMKPQVRRKTLRYLLRQLVGLLSFLESISTKNLKKCSKRLYQNAPRLIFMTAQKRSASN
jgi:hypothetical protein